MSSADIDRAALKVRDRVRLSKALAGSVDGTEPGSMLSPMEKDPSGAPPLDTFDSVLNRVNVNNIYANLAYPRVKKRMRKEATTLKEETQRTIGW